MIGIALGIVRWTPGSSGGVSSPAAAWSADFSKSGNAGALGGFY